MKVPAFRCASQNAIQILAAAFKYPYASDMQDWEYEVATLSDIEKYFEKYTSATDDDIRFVLMEMIIETSNQTEELDWITVFWPRVVLLLKSNFDLHAYTIYYWSCFDNDNVEDGFYITAYMRTLWQDVSGGAD